MKSSNPQRSDYCWSNAVQSFSYVSLKYSLAISPVNMHSIGDFTVSTLWWLRPFLLRPLRSGLDHKLLDNSLPTRKAFHFCALYFSCILPQGMCQEHSQKKIYLKILLNYQTKHFFFCGISTQPNQKKNTKFRLADISSIFFLKFSIIAKAGK